MPCQRAQVFIQAAQLVKFAACRGTWHERYLKCFATRRASLHRVRNAMCSSQQVYVHPVYICHTATPYKRVLSLKETKIRYAEAKAADKVSKNQAQNPIYGVGQA